MNEVRVMGMEEFKEALPAQMQKRVNIELMNTVNDLLALDENREDFRDNIIGMTSILKEGKFPLYKYVNAVRYISFIMMGKNQIDAYTLTFPDKRAEWDSKGKTATDISSAVSIYNKGKLVNLVREAALIPAHIYNADIFQDAVNTQAGIMNDPTVSPKIRSDAANSIMTHLKAPESKRVELDIAVNEGSAIADLRNTTAKLAEQQKRMLLDSTMNTKDIAESGLVIDGKTGDIDE